MLKLYILYTLRLIQHYWVYRNAMQLWVEVGQDKTAMSTVKEWFGTKLKCFMSNGKSYNDTRTDHNYPEKEAQLEVVTTTYSQEEKG